MSPPSPLDQTGLFYDSGPMLCLGASPMLQPSFNQFFRAHMHIADAVHREIVRISTEILRNGHPRVKQVRKRAAQAALGAYRSEFAGAIARPHPVPPVLSELEASMVEPGQHETKNRGECESIYHASITSYGLVTNDSPAARSSRGSNVRTVSFVDVNRRLLRIDRRLDREDIASELIRIARSGIDIGDLVSSSLDL